MQASARRVWPALAAPPAGRPHESEPTPANSRALARAQSPASPLTPLSIAERLVREHKVAVIPGTAFGMTEGCYFRVAYGALQRPTVAEGIGRLVTGLREILKA